MTNCFSKRSLPASLLFTNFSQFNTSAIFHAGITPAIPVFSLTKYLLAHPALPIEMAPVNSKQVRRGESKLASVRSFIVSTSYASGVPSKSLVDLRHDDFGPLNACGDQLVTPWASLGSAEQIVSRLHMQARQDCRHDPDCSLPAFVHGREFIVFALSSPHAKPGISEIAAPSGAVFFGMPDLPDIDTLSFAATCPKCQYVYPPIWEAAPAYFSQGFVECSECKAKSDLWETALERMKGMPTFVPQWILMQLGATETSFTRTITANSYQAISLDTVGVPTDATVLHISYSPQGRAGEAPVFPVHWHGNSPQRKFGNVLPLIGQPARMGDGTVGKECPVRISVLWVHQDKEYGWTYIVDALDALTLQDNARVIVPAQSAVEVTLMPVIRELLERNSSKDYVKSFMGDKLTFGNVINVLLPFMCAQADIPTMTEDIRGAMTKLRKLRNDLVHEGKRRASITTGEAIEALAAAVFAFEYVKFARPQLLARLK